MESNTDAKPVDEPTHEQPPAGDEGSGAPAGDEPQQLPSSAPVAESAPPAQSPEELLAEVQRQESESRARYVKFLTEKRTKLIGGQLMQSPCPSCGQGKFDLITQPNMMAAMHLGQPGLSPIPMVLLLCMNCGNLQVFARMFIDNVIDGKDTQAPKPPLKAVPSNPD